MENNNEIQSNNIINSILVVIKFNISHSMKITNLFKKNNKNNDKNNNIKINI